MRGIVLNRLEQDLIGPHAEEEVLTARPSDVYLTGILWPRETRMGAEEDEGFGLSGTGGNETDGGGEEEEISLAGLRRPCSAGVSFAARTVDGTPEVDVFVRFATYQPVTRTEIATDSRSAHRAATGRRARRRTEWRRNEYDIRLDSLALREGRPFTDLEPLGAPPGIGLHVVER